MPNDEAEFKRETLRHIMFKELLDGKLYLAPITQSPQKIIDLGTGFGDWAIEGSFKKISSPYDQRIMLTRSCVTVTFQLGKPNQAPKSLVLISRQYSQSGYPRMWNS